MLQLLSLDLNGIINNFYKPNVYYDRKIVIIQNQLWSKICYDAKTMLIVCDPKYFDTTMLWS